VVVTIWRGLAAASELQHSKQARHGATWRPRRTSRLELMAAQAFRSSEENM